MASPTFRSTGAIASLSSGVSGNVAVAAGSTSTTSDGMFLCVQTDVGVATISVPGNFTPVRSFTGDNFSQGIAVYFAAAGSSEPANYSVTVTGKPAKAWITTYSGVDSVTLLAGLATLSAIAGKTSTYTYPAVTAPAGSTAALFAFAAEGSTVTWTPGTGLTERVDTAISFYSACVDEKAIASAGSVSGLTVTPSTGSISAVLITVILPGASTGDATANGVTVAATTSLITGSASGVVTGTANGSTLTATASLITGSASGVVAGTLAIPVVNNTDTPQATVTIPHVTITRLSDRVQVLSLASQTTDGSGTLTLVSASLVAATAYIATGWNADGSAAFIVKVTAT